MTEKDLFIIYPPKDTTFSYCKKCEAPYIDNETSENCIWCDINEEKHIRGVTKKLE